MDLNFNYAGRCLLPECPVMLHEEHCGTGGQKEFFQLDAGKNVNKIQRFIPKEEMSRLAQRGCQKYFLFLPFAVIFDPLFELDSFQPQFLQDGPEKSIIQPAAFGKGSEVSFQPGGVLGDIRDLKPARNVYFPCVGDGSKR